MIILLGKCCGGKDTIRKELENIGYRNIVPYTTRPPRPNEKDGKDYHFVSEGDFKKMLLLDEFGEYSNFITTEGIWRYGTSKEDYKDNSVMITNPTSFKMLLNESKIKNTISFYITAPIDLRIARASKRAGTSSAEIMRRFKADEEDFESIPERVDFSIINDGRYSVTEIAKMIDMLVKGGA